MNDVYAVAFLPLLAISVGAYVYYMRRFDRSMREERKLREAKWDRYDEELRAMRCEVWKYMGDNVHRANCQRCMEQRKRGQA